MKIRLSKKHFKVIHIVIIASIVIASLATSVTGQVYPAGMVSYWKLDDGIGTIASDSVSTNDGTIYGAGWTIGQVGGALSFDGINNYVDVTPVYNSMETSKGTYMMWFYTNSFGPFSFPYGGTKLIMASGRNGILFGGNSIWLYYWDGALKTPKYDMTFQSQWYFVASTWDGSTIRLYVDGTEVASAAAGNWLPYNDQVWIGSEPYNGPVTSFAGTIDEVAVFNRALTPEEIQALYQKGLQGSGYEVGLPTAVAGTSLDGNNMLQLDGTLSNDPDGDPLTFIWQIEGEASTRTGQIVSIADIPVGNYLVTLTVSDGTYTDTDVMLFGVPAEAGVEPPPVDALQQQIQIIKDKISSFSTITFDAPNEKAAENRRKALLNMLDKVSEHISTEDYQAAIDQLVDAQVKSDGLYPPDSPPDWIIDDSATPDINEQIDIEESLSALISDLEALL